MTRVFAIRLPSRLTTIVVGLAISLAAPVPAQQTTQYGPFRITAGRWHDIGLPLRKGEYFSVVANGEMLRENTRFGADGYQLPNGNVAGKLYALSATSFGPMGTSGAGYAQIDGTLELGVLFAPQINESDATVTNGAFYAWVTAPAGRCAQVDCGFRNGTGSDLSAVTTGGAGNVATWSPYMQGILLSGYQLGIAEVGATYGPSNAANLQYVNDRLTMAKAEAERGRMNGAGIGQLIALLGQTRNPAAIARQIGALGDSYQQAISRVCTCGGNQTNPAWVFNAGRNLAYAEAATYQNWGANVMYASLSSLRIACINTRILPVDGVDGLAQLLNAGWQPGNLPSGSLNAPRNGLFAAADQMCTCY